MENKERIQKASRRLRYLIFTINCALPVINALIWIFINRLPEAMYRNILPYFVFLPLPWSARLLGFFVVMIPTGVAMLGGYYLMQLFQLYEQGLIFKPTHVHYFKRLSRVLVWWFVAGIVYRSLLSLALTLHNPPGHRMITLSLGSPDLTALLLGGILAVIAWVMEEGRKLQEDQELTV